MELKIVPENVKQVRLAESTLNGWRVTNDCLFEIEVTENNRCLKFKLDVMEATEGENRLCNSENWEVLGGTVDETTKELVLVRIPTKKKSGVGTTRNAKNFVLLEIKK